MHRQALVSALSTLIFVLTCLAGSSEPRLQQTEQAETGTITGKVLDAKDQPVPGAVVILCDQMSGVPVCRQTCRPFTEAFLAEKGDAAKDIAYQVTDIQGSFSFEKTPAGEYQLLAQSWKNIEEFKGIFEKNGKEIELHGIAERIRVSAKTSPDIVLRPLGTGILQIDQDVPNDETLLVISTQPTRTDPILGFAGWGGAFMQNMIGGNRMPKGETTVYGLPEGKVYLAMFAADSVPGWTEGQADIKPNTTTILPYIPFVNSWSNSRHDPPQRLRPLFEEMKSLREQSPPPTEDHPLVQFYELLAEKEPEGIWQWQQLISRHLHHEFELPSGRKATFADIEAVRRYIDLQQFVERRKEQNKRRQEIAETKAAIPEGQKKGSYEEAFLDLYRELGERYPCFESKKIDWKAVGEKFLPRAKQVKSDDGFGLLCMELVARLEDSHAHLLEGSAKLPQISFPQWDPGFACLEDDQARAVVYYVDQDGPAEQVGVQVGMIVVTISGEEAKDAIQRTMNQIKKYAGYSSDRYLRYHAHRFFIRQKERGTIVKLEMLDGDGEVHSSELPANLGVRYLPRLPVPKAGINDAGSVSWKTLDGQIGYIYVRRIRGDLIELLDKAVGELKDARGLIVDVRGNSGGGFDSKRAPLNFALDRDSEEPERPRYKGPMALLIDSRCISAGEGWASWFIANERARVFGQATAGASSRKTVYELKNGLYKVRFPVKAYKGYLDRPIERVGLVPNVPVRQNTQDLIKGRDTVLETAMRYLVTAGKGPNGGCLLPDTPGNREK